MPLTPVVKILIISNVALWATLVLIGQGMIMQEPLIFQWFGLVPFQVISEFWLWQIFTYMFIHSNSVFHVFFNMLILWMFGGELESRWGGRFFLTYYLVCGIGAGLIYLVSIGIYALLGGNALYLQQPVVGASGAVFGLLVAYGILFGERTIYFMMMFPMKARYFVMIIGALEFFTLMSSGFGSGVANMAHLGGLISGFLFLAFYSKWKGRRLRKKTHRHGRRLKLVVDNDNTDDPKNGPRYWN